MALYSVWDWDRNSWRIYQTPAHVSVGDDAHPPRPSNVSPIGADPDTQVKPLPSGAKLQGFSHVARGEVRRTPQGIGNTGDDAGSPTAPLKRPWVMFGLGAAVASAWWWWRRREGRA